MWGKILLLSCFLLACGPNLNEVMQSWVGHHRDDLLRSWGPPAQETKLSNGGAILTYRNTGQVFMPVGSMMYGVPVTCQKDFEIDSAGRIVRWRFQGC